MIIRGLTGLASLNTQSCAKNSLLDVHKSWTSVLGMKTSEEIKRSHLKENLVLFLYLQCHLDFPHFFMSLIQIKTNKFSHLGCLCCLPRRCRQKRRCLAPRWLHQRPQLFSLSPCWAAYRACPGPGLWFLGLGLGSMEETKQGRILHYSSGEMRLSVQRSPQRRNTVQELWELWKAWMVGLLKQRFSQDWGRATIINCR